MLREMGKNTTGKGDVFYLVLDSGRGSESSQNGEQGTGGESRCFVGQGVSNGSHRFGKYICKRNTIAMHLAGATINSRRKGEEGREKFEK